MCSPTVLMNHLVSALGNGGQSLFALDVTNPSAFSEKVPAEFIYGNSQERMIQILAYSRTPLYCKSALWLGQ